MNKRFLFIFILILNFSIFPQSLTIRPIEFGNLDQEKILFVKFLKVFCGINSENEIFEQVVQNAFQLEEKDYLDHLPTVLFFHALFDDQVVGYISCDLLPGHHVHIRQIMVDPEIFTVGLVKELLFSIFENYSKAKIVTVSCLVGCQEMIQFFKSLGFTKIDPILRHSLEFCMIYELKVSSKCKICELLYPNVWKNEQDDEVGNRESEQEDLEA